MPTTIKEEGITLKEQASKVLQDWEWILNQCIKVLQEWFMIVLTWTFDEVSTKEILLANDSLMCYDAFTF